MIPANYYNEYVLLARTMQQQKIRPQGIYSILGGAASSYKLVKEFPEAAQYIMDCNHWFDPKNPKAMELKKKVDAKGDFFTYEVYMNYSGGPAPCRRAGEKPQAPTAGKSSRRWRASTFAGHVMPYGPTKFVNGQNQGAAPVNTQVIGNDIQVIFPADVRVTRRCSRCRRREALKMSSRASAAGSRDPCFQILRFFEVDPG